MRASARRSTQRCPRGWQRHRLKQQQRDDTDDRPPQSPSLIAQARATKLPAPATPGNPPGPRPRRIAVCPVEQTVRCNAGDLDEQERESQAEKIGPERTRAHNAAVAQRRERVSINSRDSGPQKPACRPAPDNPCPASSARPGTRNAINSAATASGKMKNYGRSSGRHDTNYSHEKLLRIVAEQGNAPLVQPGSRHAVVPIHFIGVDARNHAGSKPATAEGPYASDVGGGQRALLTSKVLVCQPRISAS